MHFPKTFNFSVSLAIWVIGLYPIGWLSLSAYSNELGANPIEFSNRYLGKTAINFLFACLTITPIRIITGIASVIRLRKALGLFAFFYASLHVCFYISFDQFFSWFDIWQDLIKRQYISFGFIAFLILIPLAVTSTKSMIKRLGAVYWKRLHNAIYFAAILVSIHFFMMRKGIQHEPIYYILFLLSIYCIRIVFF